MTSSHTEFTLPVLLKELDHIQAIVGRFDTFFFLMKQLCLVYVSAVLGLYFTSNQMKMEHPAVALLIPAVFLLFETAFRYCFWTKYIRRVATIKGYLNGEVEHPKLYMLIEEAPRTVTKEAPRTDGVRGAVKPFDLIFYVVVFLMTAMFSWSDISALAKFAFHAASGCHNVQTLVQAPPVTKPTKP